MFKIMSKEMRTMNLKHNNKGLTLIEIIICIAIIGGSIGVFCGMNAFRHKTKHNKFSIGIPIIIFLQVILFLMLKS